MGKNQAAKKYHYITASTIYNGKQVKGYGQSKKEARENLNRKLKERMEAEVTGNKVYSNSITVAEYAPKCIDAYLAPRIRDAAEAKEKGKLSPKSAAMYETKLKLYIYPAIGDMPVASISHMQLQILVNDAVAKNQLSLKTCKDIIWTLELVFRSALNDNLIQKNPAVKLISSGEKKQKRRALTEEEQGWILDYNGPNRDADMFKTQLETGLRDAEMCNLKVRYVDLENRVIYVELALQSGTARIEGEPKSENGKRKVPMSDRAYAILARLVENKAPDDYVFTNLSGNMITVREYIRRWHCFWHEIDIQQGAETTPHGHIYDPSDVDDYGVPLYPDKDGLPRNGHKIDIDVTPYYLRHTFSTNLSRAGVEWNAIKAIMGHDDITTTVEYTHADMSDIRRATALINKYNTESQP